MGENAIDTISDIVDAMGSSGDDTLSKVLDAFGDKFGKRQYGALQFFPIGFRWNSFVLEPFVTNRNFIEMRVPTLPRLSLLSDTRMGANISYARMLGKSLELGLTVRPFSRIYVQGDVAATDVVQIATAESADTDKYITTANSTYAATDIGAIWAFSPGFRWGLTITDVGDSASTSKAADRAPIIPARVSTGIFYRKNFAGTWHFDSTFDLQDIMNRGHVDTIRMLHGGLEVGKNYLTSDNDMGLQAGISDGWFSFGGFLDIWLARLTLANYGVEAGHSPGQRQDRRWALSLQTSLTF